MSEFHGCSNRKGLAHGKNTLKWFFEFEVSVDYDYSKDEGIAHVKNTLMILYESKVSIVYYRIKRRVLLMSKIPEMAFGV